MMDDLPESIMGGEHAKIVPTASSENVVVREDVVPTVMTALRKTATVHQIRAAVGKIYPHPDEIVRAAAANLKTISADCLDNCQEENYNFPLKSKLIKAEKCANCLLQTYCNAGGKD
jgi:hypothetical protein